MVRRAAVRRFFADRQRLAHLGLYVLADAHPHRPHGRANDDRAMREDRTMRRAAAGLFAGLAALLTLIQAGKVRAENPLVADLSRHLLEITTGFTGARVLLFGAVDGSGDVVVVVRGPSNSITMRRKSRVFGIWMNTRSMKFPNVPSFYALSTSAPLHKITTPAVRARNGIGVTNLPLRPATQGLPKPERAAWQQGLIRAKQRKGHYARKPARVNFLGERLFRTKLFFPATVPTGHYRIEVYLLRDKQVVSAQTTPLIVSKAGLEAELYQFAHKRATFYGMLAVAVAALAGWLASVIFRRD